MELEMTWQPTLLKKKGPPLGLRNLGNSCYLNSVLQCLTYTPPLANFCLRSQHSDHCDCPASRRDCPFCILERRIARSLSLDLLQDSPQKIQSCLRIFADHFRCGRQEDAHEFLRYVIDACHNSCLRIKKLRRKGSDASGGSSIVKQIFGGELQSQVKCLSCGTESNKVDEIMDISLDILHSSSLREAIHKFFQPEILDGSNKYKCDNCKKLVAAKKQMSIRQAPNILVVQLKRFEGIFGGKIDKAIAFEEVLVLSSFMCNMTKDCLPEYNLFGTIVHSGYSPDSGHYYAYIKDAMGRWYCCNDQFVSLSTAQEVLSEKVYILFFALKNRRSISSHSTVTSNGTESCYSNGTVEPKGYQNDIQSKTRNLKQNVEPLPRRDMLISGKTGNVSSSPKIRFNIVEKSGVEKFSASGNGKVEKNKSMISNGDAKRSAHVEKTENYMPSTMLNGSEKRRKVDALDSGRLQPIAAGKENDSKLVKVENGSDHSSVGSNANGCAESSMTSCKRNPMGASVLLDQDPALRAEVDKLKHLLEKEAMSTLRACGWYDNVTSFLQSRKLVLLKEDGHGQSRNELKKKLIQDGKATFLSQIPESLKESLIKDLQSFAQGK